MPATELWNRCLSALSEKVNQKSFDIWLKPLKALNLKDTILEIEVPNKFFKDWISENYQAVIRDVLHQLTQKSFSLTLSLREGKEEETKEAKETKGKGPAVSQDVSADDKGRRFEFELQL